MTEIDYAASEICPLEDSLAYLVGGTAREVRGFSVDSAAGDKDGWLVWVVAEDSTLSDNSELSLVTYRHSMTMDKDTLRYQLPDPVTTEYVVGGFYVVPQNTAVGVLDFKLAGFAVLKDGHWYLVIENVADEYDAEDASMITRVQVVTEDDGENDMNSGSSRRIKKKRR